MLFIQGTSLEYTSAVVFQPNESGPLLSVNINTHGALLIFSILQEKEIYYIRLLFQLLSERSSALLMPDKHKH